MVTATLHYLLGLLALREAVQVASPEHRGSAVGQHQISGRTMPTRESRTRNFTGSLAPE